MGNLNSRLQKINARLQSINRLAFILVLTATIYILAISFNYALLFIKEEDIIFFDFPGEEKNIVFIFFIPVIIAPIFETFFNQYLPYYLLNKIKYFHERNYLILLASALFFGLLHFYSVFYIVYAFLLGLVLMYGYMLRIKTDNKTFYLIAISHSLLNLGIFIKNLI